MKTNKIKPLQKFKHSSLIFPIITTLAIFAISGYAILKPANYASFAKRPTPDPKDTKEKKTPKPTNGLGYDTKLPPEGSNDFYQFFEYANQVNKKFYSGNCGTSQNMNQNYQNNNCYKNCIVFYNSNVCRQAASQYAQDTSRAENTDRGNSGNGGTLNSGHDTMEWR